LKLRAISGVGETVVIDAVRLRELNGEVDWKWRAIGSNPPRWSDGA
jgi:hypothetical protein